LRRASARRRSTSSGKWPDLDDQRRQGDPRQLPHARYRTRSSADPPLKRGRRSCGRLSGSMQVETGLSNMPCSGPREILYPGAAHRRAGREGAHRSRVALRSERRTGVGVTSLSRLIAYPPGYASSGRVCVRARRAGESDGIAPGRRLGKQLVRDPRGGGSPSSDRAGGPDCAVRSEAAVSTASISPAHPAAISPTQKARTMLASAMHCIGRTNLVA
jgi:hypothetical protein